jgi:hypothetical protein
VRNSFEGADDRANIRCRHRPPPLRSNKPGPLVGNSRTARGRRKEASEAGRERGDPRRSDTRDIQKMSQPRVRAALGHTDSMISFSTAVSLPFAEADPFGTEKASCRDALGRSSCRGETGRRIRDRRIPQRHRPDAPPSIRQIVSGTTGSGRRSLPVKLLLLAIFSSFSVKPSLSDDLIAEVKPTLCRSPDSS